MWPKKDLDHDKKKLSLYWRDMIVLIMTVGLLAIAILDENYRRMFYGIATLVLSIYFGIRLFP